jgi:hypothetical protein
MRVCWVCVGFIEKSVVFWVVFVMPLVARKGVNRDGTLMTLFFMMVFDFEKPQPKSLSQGEGLWVWWVEVFWYWVLCFGCFGNGIENSFLFVLRDALRNISKSRWFLILKSLTLNPSPKERDFGYGGWRFFGIGFYVLGVLEMELKIPFYLCFEMPCGTSRRAEK